MNVVQTIVSLLGVVELVVNFLVQKFEEVIFSCPEVVSAEHVVKALNFNVFLEEYVVEKV